MPLKPRRAEGHDTCLVTLNRRSGSRQKLHERRRDLAERSETSNYPRWGRKTRLHGNTIDSDHGSFPLYVPFPLETKRFSRLGVPKPPTNGEMEMKGALAEADASWTISRSASRL